ncbi:MAG: hypothetical protein FWF43_01605 [Propionibacteriaceae bacterium]|nr:hypothetical protein [Propionibacteriaceae bacterium]
MEWLLAELGSSRLLADGPPQSGPVKTVVEGTGILADQISALLADIPGSGLEDDDSGPVLHVVASETVDADRVMIANLTNRRIPHLIVRASEYSASVGPFVIPGVTSCVTCCDLERRTLDPSWPIQVFQLSRIPVSPSPVLSAWATATAVAHIMAFAQGLMPESAWTSVELSAIDGRVTYRPWPRHPDCPHH